MLKGNGGRLTASNLKLLHPACHEEHHANSDSNPAFNGGLKRLEPCAGKLARTVLRGGSDGNVTSLPDTSVQAQFLIPMVVSLSFGVLFSTLVTLLLVPNLYLLGERFRADFIRVVVKKAGL